MTSSRRITECDHKNTISTITAGMERVVCEACGHVSVRFIATAVRIYPDVGDTAVPESEEDPQQGDLSTGCHRCGGPVQFMTPSGLACTEHAWKEASKQQIMGSEPWIPIRIDQRTKAS